MGYFSEMSLNMSERYCDRGAETRKDALIMRYEDLKAHYEELLLEDAPVEGDHYFSADDYRYASEQSFDTLSDTMRAMELAADTLEAEYGISVRDGQSSRKSTVNTEIDENQISFFEVVCMPWVCAEAVA